MGGEEDEMESADTQGACLAWSEQKDPRHAIGTDILRRHEDERVGTISGRYEVRHRLHVRTGMGIGVGMSTGMRVGLSMGTESFGSSSAALFCDFSARRS